MSSSIKNRDVRSISIGSKISLLFKDSSIIEEQPALVGIIGIDKTQEDEDSHFPEMVDLLDKVWIQIGENERIYGDKKRSNEAIKEEIVFSLSEQMIDDFKHTKMMYAGVNHRKYNIKTCLLYTSDAADE